MRSMKYVWSLSFMAIAFFVSCNKWDEHVAIKEEALNENLMEQIGRHTNLSKFRDYLVKTGLDKDLSASKNFTVWAPTDAALAGLSPDTVNDVAKLKAFLENHIAGQLFFTRMASDPVRVAMLNNKRVSVYGKKFDEATIQEADIYVKNGVLNVIDKAVSPLPSLWEFISSTGDEYLQNSFIASLNNFVQDPAKAELDSINPVTGEPVYKPGTGLVEVNSFRNYVYDVANEDSLFTYILLNDQGFTSDVESQKPYFQSALSPTKTDTNAAWNIAKDMAIKGMYEPDQLPESLLSRFNVHVTIDRSRILKTVRVSNGIVYVMSEAPAPLSEKIPAVIIQGENPAGFSSLEDKYMTKVFHRTRKSPDGNTFNDIYLNLGSSGTNFSVFYVSNKLYTVKYKVYWVALNDKTISGQGDDPYGTDSTLTQSLSLNFYQDGVLTPSAFNVSSPVLPYDYSEVYLGEYTDNSSYDFSLPFEFSKVNNDIRSAYSRVLQLSSPSAARSGIPNNLTLDYIKLVPEF